MENCIFCDVDLTRVIDFNRNAYVIKDGFPVTDGHSLIIPIRHTPDYFDLTEDEVHAVNAMLSKTKQVLVTSDQSITGFNVGINIGESAGQTVKHCHIHLIPRRYGDVEDPRGGVRHTIPGKGNY